MGTLPGSWKFPGLQIIQVNGAFFGTALHADNATDPSCGLQEREQVEDEAAPRVVFQS